MTLSERGGGGGGGGKECPCKSGDAKGLTLS